MSENPVSEPTSSVYTLFGRVLKNRFVFASGMTQNTSEGLLSCAESTGVSVVTTKSISLQEREGNPHPRIHHIPYGMLNALGIPSVGVNATLPELERFKEASPKELAISLYAGDAEGFVQLAQRLDCLDAIYLELNLSCPNVLHAHSIPLAADAGAVKTVVARLKDKDITTPIVAKLSPQVAHIASVAEGALEAGVDGFTLVNTIPALLFDHKTGSPVLGFGSGGMSGPALHPIAVKAVHDVRQLSQKIPIIGSGGVYSVEAAQTMLLAGATMISIGSLVYKKGMGAAARLISQFSHSYT